MGVFHVFQIVQMLPNRATHHKYDCLLSGVVFPPTSTKQFEIHIFDKNIHRSNTEN